MRNFIFVWLGELVSNIGSGMTSFAVAIFVYELTGKVSFVSLFMFFAFFPSIFFSPVGGVLADKLDRRLMMILGDSLSVIGLAFIFIGVQYDFYSLFFIFFGVGISSFFMAFLEPAYKASVSDFLPKKDFSKGSALAQISGAAKFLVSPVLAGFVLSVWDIRVILMIDVLTFFVTVGIILVIKKNFITAKTKKRFSDFLRDFREGFLFVFNNKAVVDLVLLMFFVCFFVGFLQTLLTPLILSFSSARVLGFLESFGAIGLLVGSLILGFLRLKNSYARVLMVSLVVSALFMTTIGIFENIFFIAVMCFLFFFSIPFINTCAEVLIRLSFSNDKQGRVWGIVGFLTQLGYVFAYLISGLLADYVFSPMFTEGGALFSSVGKIIGVGEGRGVGFLIIISGIFMLGFVLFIGLKKHIWVLEKGGHFDFKNG